MASAKRQKPEGQPFSNSMAASGMDAKLFLSRYNLSCSSKIYGNPLERNLRKVQKDLRRVESRRNLGM